MKYNQPFDQPTVPNAPYVDGNPSTGTPGSIPPAASIEYPQREIVNLLGAVGFTPTNANLLQLAQAIQSCITNYSVDSGTSNNYVATLSPAPAALYPGMEIRVKMMTSPTGPSVINVNAIGNHPIIKSGAGVLVGGEWQIGDVVKMTFDGTNWQLPAPPIATLFANKNYYVATTGNDTLNDGLTALTPFATLQKAQNTALLYNLNGFNVTINVANGTYAPVNCGRINGSGQIVYLGNHAFPSNCLVSTSDGPCFEISGQGYTIDGFKGMSSGHASGVVATVVYALVGGSVAIVALDCGNCLDFHIAADQGAQISMYGPITISGVGAGHMIATNGSVIKAALIQPSLTITAGTTISNFVFCSNNAIIQVHYSSIIGFAFVSGTKYLAASNGVIDASGAGINYYPGGTAGSTQTGGQYV
jgi:hypothetical protein